MFYVSTTCIIVITWGGEGEKILDILEGDPKKWKFSNFHPSPFLINNEYSLSKLNLH